MINSEPIFEINCVLHCLSGVVLAHDGVSLFLKLYSIPFRIYLLSTLLLYYLLVYILKISITYEVLSGKSMSIEIRIWFWFWFRFWFRFQKGCHPIVCKYNYSKHRIAKWGQMIPLFSTIGWKSRRGEKLFLMQRGVGAAAAVARQRRWCEVGGLVGKSW